MKINKRGFYYRRNKGKIFLKTASASFLFPSWTKHGCHLSAKMQTLMKFR